MSIHETKHKEETMRQLQLALSLASALVVGFASRPEARADAQPTPIKATWSALGKTYCLGHVERPATCDVHFLRPKILVTLLGKTWCFGDAPGVVCDVSFPRPEQRPPESVLARWLRDLQDHAAKARNARASTERWR